MRSALALPWGAAMVRIGLVPSTTPRWPAPRGAGRRPLQPPRPSCSASRSRQGVLEAIEGPAGRREAPPIIGRAVGRRFHEPECRRARPPRESTPRWTRCTRPGPLGWGNRSPLRPSTANSNYKQTALKKMQAVTGPYLAALKQPPAKVGFASRLARTFGHPPKLLGVEMRRLRSGACPMGAEPDRPALNGGQPVRLNPTTHHPLPRTRGAPLSLGPEGPPGA